MDAVSEELPDDVAGLVAQLMLHSSQQTTHLLDGLMKGYRRDYERTRAELRAVRNKVSLACSQPWAPDPDYIIGALYPSEQEIAKYLPADWEE
jgi:hypothetical protein